MSADCYLQERYSHVRVVRNLSYNTWTVQILITQNTKVLTYRTRTR